MHNDARVVLVQRNAIFTPNWRDVKSLPGCFNSCKWFGRFVLLDGEYQGKRGLIVVASQDEVSHEDCVRQFTRLFGEVHKVFGGGGLSLGVLPNKEGVLTFSISGRSKLYGSVDRDFVKEILHRNFPSAEVYLDADHFKMSFGL
jgi:hypothetical protein